MCFYFFKRIKKKNEIKKQNEEIVRHLETLVGSFFWEESLSRASCESESCESCKPIDISEIELKLESKSESKLELESKSDLDLVSKSNKGVSPSIVYV